MKLNRRETLCLAGGAFTAAALGAAAIAPAVAKPDEVQAIIDEFAGGKPVQEGRITLTTPEIAENGNTVPVKVNVDSPMTAEDHVTQVMLMADDNPQPGVVTFNFTEMSGQAYVSTRIRLARTQNVVVVAKMSTGAVYMNKKYIKVTIGGCGG